MTDRRIEASIEVSISPALCIRAIQESLTDERLLVAYRALRPGREFSGFVTMLVPDRHLKIAFAGFDPSSGKRYHSAGWTIIYDFRPALGGRTRVTIAVEYPLLAAIAAGGTMRTQAENELHHRLAHVVAVEMGFHGTSGSADG